MPGTVSFVGTNITLAEAGDATFWDDIGGGQGSSQDTGVVIQGAEARSRRIDNRSGGFGFDAQTGLNLSAANTHVGFWANVLQPAQLTSINLSISGSGTSALGSPFRSYLVTPSSFPTQGGFTRYFVNVSADFTGSGGNFNSASVRNFGAEFTMGDVGGNAPNCILDRIDFTASGLSVVDGTAPSPATFSDAVAFDQGNPNNSFGVIGEANGVLFQGARITIGQTATIFNDSGFALVFQDQPFVSDTFMGLTCDLSNASTSIDFTGSLIRSGGSKLGDLVYSGVAGAASLVSMTLDRLRVIELTQAVTVSNSAISSSGTVTQNGASISNVSITNSTAAVALDSDAPNALSAITLTGNNTAIRITTPGTYDLSAWTFSGNTTDVFNDSGGLVTINPGTNSLVTQDGAGATTVIQANLTNVNLTGLIAAPPTEVRVYEGGSTTEISGQEDVTSGSFSFATDAGSTVDIRIANVEYEPADIVGFLVPGSDTTIPISQRFDRNYANAV